MSGDRAAFRAAAREAVDQAAGKATEPESFAAFLAAGGYGNHGVTLFSSPLGRWLREVAGVEAAIVGARRVTFFSTLGEEYQVHMPAGLAAFEAAWRAGRFKQLPAIVEA